MSVVHEQVVHEGKVELSDDAIFAAMSITGLENWQEAVEVFCTDAIMQGRDPQKALDELVAQENSDG